MTDILFYHLQRQPLEAVLPTLVEKSLARGWRVAIEVPDAERLTALDDHLWIWRDDSFLPHGTDQAADCADEPVLLTRQHANLNRADVRFLVDGAGIADDAGSYARIVLMFDGNDDAALARARDEWRKVRAMGFAATYWQQDEAGRWIRKG
ncbi:DNA polymerase-3 subunit chi [Pseudochelatococcus lubricantis]|uniref:DNA polymerase-3 subunit chi n=1 Tax=Pseudochelatococcus lubricantis TaxID=1538102 RepID=A0ABX0UYC7_9HYPH|nr:DNA polymerase III subunit chi [Pseudochelatococcus lubricantis]NIJ57373.1 DNA polymerase-3 subunit chi [Pseudochelatococcus lubricantis]